VALFVVMVAARRPDGQLSLGARAVTSRQGRNGV